MSVEYDPVEMLRHCVIHSMPVTYDPEKRLLVFVDVACLESTPTSIKKKSSTANETYTLGALWFLHQKKDLSFGEYLAEAKMHKFEAVGKADSKDILNYLTGETSTIQKVDLFDNKVEWIHLKGCFFFLVFFGF